jgi:hypothetical protein
MSEEWLTPLQVRAEFDIPQSDLQSWRRLGCPALRDKKLRAKPMKGLRSNGRQHGQIRPRFLYHRADVELINATPITIDGSFKDGEGKAWLSAEAAQDQFGFKLITLSVWRRNGCHFWRGRKPRARKFLIRTRTRKGIRFHRLWFFLIEDLQEISEARAKGGDQIEDGTQWCDKKAAKDLFGFGSWTLIQLVQQKKVRSRLVTRILDGSTTRRIREYLKEDLAAVQSEKVRSPSLRDHGREDWLVYRQVKQQYGYGHDQLSGWREHRCCHLGRKLRATQGQDWIPTKRGPRLKPVWRFSKADLEEIASKRAIPLHAPHVDKDGTWLPESVATTKYPINRKTLRKHRQRSIRAKQVARTVKNAMRSGMIWMYSEGDVQRFIENGHRPTLLHRPAVNEAPIVSSRKPTGRKRSHDTAELNRFCYEARMHGIKRSRVMVMANSQFERKVVTASRYVTTYANRHAERSGLTFNPPDRPKSQPFNFEPLRATEKGPQN